jgi:D-3-phosphoglycerate dehydrogenase / 2-oxoglutarate reductase
MIVSCLEPYSVAALARLHAQGHEVNQKADAKTEILLIRSRTKIDARLLSELPALKLVVTSTSGFDHVDWRECEKRGVIATHTPEANAQSTAELTLSLMLAWERQILQAHKNVKNNHWREGLKRPVGLDGRQLGIIGLGRVGSRVAKMAVTFGMKIQAYDPYVELEQFCALQCERIGIIELLRTSDIVSLHVPLTKETLHLLNHATFKEMQNDALLINTCRGPVVSENDLMAALDEGTITGAAMDVIEREPPRAGHRVLNHPKLLLTPHIGAFTERAWEKASHEAVDKVIAFAAGKPLSDTLPLQVPWFDKC